MTDAALERLAGLPQLQELQLDDAVISQRGLKSLTELPNLRALSFQDCSLSDDSLKALYKARSLVGLRVSETDVTEAGILGYSGRKSGSGRPYLAKRGRNFPACSNCRKSKSLPLRAPSRQTRRWRS